MKGLVQPGVILRSFGISITVIGVLMLSAIPFAIYFREDTIVAILLSSLISLFAGQTVTLLTKSKKNSEISERDAFFIVTLTWFMAGFFGSLPFILSGSISNFTNAYFETISGFSTTGASILSDVEALPKSILYWRSLTHWLGGMGIIVLVIAILPHLGFGGVKLFIAESPGATATKLHPKIRITAICLWGVYVLLTGLLIVLLMLGNMSFFDSICHSFGALSTGGFSTKNASISNYSSYTQWIIALFMFFGGVNFTLHYFLLTGKIKQVLKNEELIGFVLFVAFVSLIVSLTLFLNGNYTEFSTALRHGFFQCVSIVTATGFASADYLLWPQTTWLWLLLMFFTGGMIGSTSGGIKFTRHFVLLKNLRSEIKKMIHPHTIIQIKLNKKNVSEDTIKIFFIIFIAYILVFCTGTLLLSIYLDNPLEAFGATVSCLGGVGPAFGQFGPVGNYSSLASEGKWILSIIMILGRIEIIPFILIFTKSFWKV